MVLAGFVGGFGWFWLVPCFSLVCPAIDAKLRHKIVKLAEEITSRRQDETEFIVKSKCWMKNRVTNQRGIELNQAPLIFSN